MFLGNLENLLYIVACLPFVVWFSWCALVREDRNHKEYREEIERMRNERKQEKELKHIWDDVFENEEDRKDGGKSN